MIPLPGMTGDLEALAMYAGQSVALVADGKPAAEVVRDMASEAVIVIERLRDLRGVK